MTPFCYNQCRDCLCCTIGLLLLGIAEQLESLIYNVMKPYNEVHLSIMRALLLWVIEYCVIQSQWYHAALQVHGSWVWCPCRLVYVRHLFHPVPYEYQLSLNWSHLCNAHNSVLAKNARYITSFHYTMKMSRLQNLLGVGRLNLVTACWMTNGWFLVRSSPPARTQRGLIMLDSFAVLFPISIRDLFVWKWL